LYATIRLTLLIDTTESEYSAKEMESQLAKSKNLGLIRIMCYHMKKGKMAKKKLPTKGGYNPHAKVHEELIKGKTVDAQAT